MQKSRVLYFVVQLKLINIEGGKEEKKIHKQNPTTLTWDV